MRTVHTNHKAHSTLLSEDIWFYIFMFMNFRTLQTLRSVDSRFRNLAAYALNSRLNNMLSRYITYPTQLRQLLDSSSSAISGSFALAFTYPSAKWEPADLDIYTTPTGADGIVEYFELNGYIAKTTLTEDDSTHVYTPGIAKIITLSKKSNSIDLVVSKTVSCLYPISLFWNSFLFTFITANHVCSGYPQHTANSEGHVTRNWRADDKVPALVSKYIERGYISSTPHQPLNQTARHFGDSKCLTLQFGEVERNTYLDFVKYRGVWED